MAQTRIDEYLALREVHPGWFDNSGGGVEVLVDPEAILAAERETGARYVARGMPPEWAEVGIRYRDPYLLLLRDAVRFPDGGLGVHHRIMRGQSDPSGVAVLPRLADGRLLLVRHFRHPTRRWHWEAPRGGIERGADAAGTARTELAEEIGAVVNGLTPLGTVHGSTGLMGLSVQLYLADVASVGQPALGEGITGIRAVTAPELESMVREGEVTDGFTLACILHARLRGIL